MQDLGEARRNLTLAVLKSEGQSVSVADRLQAFRQRYAVSLQAMRELLEELMVTEHINVAALTVANREAVRQSRGILEECL